MRTLRGVDRRHLLLGAAALPLVAACGSDDDAPDSATSGDAPAGGAADPGGSPSAGGAGSGGQTLASTADVEVGGAVFLEGVVVTQPAAGEFHAFERTCTHMACPVTDLQGGKIHCSCHGSLFDPATGEAVGGPASSPLTSISVRVDGDKIVTA